MLKNITSADDIAPELKSLYRQYGYKLYKMNRFEEYDLYSGNRDFLRGDNIITFNNSKGRLMALKPDVTLSIVKNAPTDGALRKVYYSENVYRAPRGSAEIREIPQIGLECLGDIDSYRTYEVLFLAAKSLSALSDEFAIDISHMGFLSPILDAANVRSEDRKEIVAHLSSKNPHDLKALCDKIGLDRAITAKLAELASISGDFSGETLSRLESIAEGVEGSERALAELKILFGMFDITDVSAHLNIDFSVVNDMRYYNGIVFLGYLKGVPTPVLSGGRYDNLPKKFGKNCGALGFALDLGLLEQFSVEVREYDADVLVTYSAATDPVRIVKECEKLRSLGKSVYVAMGDGSGIMTRSKIDLSEDGEV